MQTDSTLLENSPLNIADTFTLPHSEAQHYGLDSNSFTDNSISTIQPEQIIYIDSAVEDYQVLIDSLNQPTEIILLDSQQDGLVQISESLQQYQGVEFEAIHIVSHGDIGELFLGNTSLKQDNLDNYQDVLSSWSDSIAADGDILLYGCNVGADLAGAEFLETFSQYTQADILASTDLTGSEDLGGDWDLEFAVGEIEAESAFDESIGSDYQSALVGSNFDLATNPIFNDYIDTNFPITGGIPRLNFVFNSDLTNPNLNFNSDFQTANPNQLNNILGINLNNYSYANSGYNSILFGFEPAEFNFDSTNFNFSSVAMDNRYITFDFEPSDFNFNFANGLRDSMDFGFDEYEFRFDSMFKFDAEEMRFDGNSVRFEYDNFDFSRGMLSQSHTHLLNYKFTESEIFNIDSETEFVQQLNASDFRALTYAFDGDFMFDSDYYIKEYNIDPNQNPFTDYNEQAIGLYRNPNAMFDDSFYIASNADLVELGITGLEDYMRGWRAGLPGDPAYDPDKNTNFNSSFSAEDYFTIHDDVRIESYDPEANSPLQDLMAFGITEGRITSEISLSDDVLEFSTLINSNSESFEYVQNQINNSNVGVQVSPAEDGKVSILRGGDSILEPIVRPIVDLLKASFFVGGSFLLSKSGEILYEINKPSIFGNYSGVPVFGSPGTPPFLIPPEGKIVVESFPGSDAITFNGDNIFTTPLEPITDLDTTTTFPGRDEILAELLEGPFIFPDRNLIPQQLFSTINTNDLDWSELYEDGQDPRIIINPPTQTDFSREAGIRQDIVNNNNIKRANQRNIGFADYQFTDKFGNITSGTIESFSGPVNADDYALYVPLNERILRPTNIGGKVIRTSDTEGKILEQLLADTTASDSGFIRIYTQRPVCDSCGITIEEFLQLRPKIDIEVIEGS